jgi:DNA-binding MltR family transcriptional regulator
MEAILVKIPSISRRNEDESVRSFTFVMICGAFRRQSAAASGCPRSTNRFKKVDSILMSIKTPKNQKVEESGLHLNE